MASFSETFTQADGAASGWTNAGTTYTIQVVGNRCQTTVAWTGVDVDVFSGMRTLAFAPTGDMQVDFDCFVPITGANAVQVMMLNGGDFGGFSVVVDQDNILLRRFAGGVPTLIATFAAYSGRGSPLHLTWTRNVAGLMTVYSNGVSVGSHTDNTDEADSTCVITLAATAHATTPGWIDNLVVKDSITAPQVITLPKITNTSTLHTPTVTPGASTISLPKITNTSVLHAPTITTGVGIALPRIVNTSTLHPPTVTTGAVTVTLPKITNTSTLYTPAVAHTGIATYSDNFNRADGALGANWIGAAGSTLPAISTNKVVAATGTLSAALWNTDLGVDQWAQITGSIGGGYAEFTLLTRFSTGETGFNFAWTSDGSTAAGGTIDGYAWQLWRKATIEGVWTLVHETAASSTEPSTLLAYSVGDRHILWADDEVVIDHIDATPMAGRKTGFSLYHDAAPATDVDNFSCGDTALEVPSYCYLGADRVIGVRLGTTPVDLFDVLVGSG